MAQLEGKIALVTGASAGIGRATALELAREGAAVAVLARSRDKLESLAAEIRAAGGKALALAADVSDAGAVQEAVDTAILELGGLHLLVNNAGITRDNLILRMKDEDWDAVLETNLKSAFLFCRAAAKHFLRQKEGGIINIASVVGLTGNAGQANYAASKGGLIAFTLSLAKELASRGIRVNAVAPGFIETAMTDALPESARESTRSLIPLGRFGSPLEIAKVVAFLAGPGASYITGATLRVDGGLAMG
jgi:3-oxoacyl-[acyl-carrier protein] reductase